MADDIPVAIVVVVERGVVVLVSDDNSGRFQMLNDQNDGSVIDADSGPAIISFI